MASKPDHLERTATEPRDRSLNTVIIEHIDEINDTTRVFRLGIAPGSSPIRFLPGQWLDVYLPGIERAGGFTITSTPRDARSSGGKPNPTTTTSTGGTSGDSDKASSLQEKKDKKEESKGPYLELAIQKNPSSPQASWLWRDPSITTTTATATAPAPALFGAELRVRVGGGFVWPPPGINVRSLRRVVFVAGGVGVNPLVSMLSSIATTTTTTTATTATNATTAPFEVRFLYSLKDPLSSSGEGEGEGKGKRNRREARRMLFLERIARLFREGRVKGRLEVFLTGGKDEVEAGEEGKGVEDGIVCDGGEGKEKGEGEGEGDEDGGFTIPFHARRCTVEDDVTKALGDTPADRRFAVVYVCGVPTMTDEFVAKLTDREKGLGMESHRVLCEKWW